MAFYASADLQQRAGASKPVTAADLAGLIKEHGGWGLSVILMVVVAKLYRDNQKLGNGSIERLISSLGAATTASDGVQKALTELRGLIDASSKTVGEHTHQIGILIEKVQHGFGNTSSAMQGVTNELQRIRDDRRDRAERGRS